MIRMNLLRSRCGARLDSAEPLAASGSGWGFISGRELTLGLLLLLIGGGALHFLLRDTPDAVASETVASSPEPELLAEGPVVPPAENSAAPASADAEAAEEDLQPAAQPPGEPQPAASTTASISTEPLIGPVEEIANGASAPGEGAITSLDPAIQPRAEQAAPAPPEIVNREEEPATAAGQLTKLFVTQRNGSLHIFAATGNQPKYKAFLLQHPNRVVVDLEGVLLALEPASRDQTVDHPRVHRIRAAQFQLDPPVTRFVLDVSATDPPDIEVFAQFNGIYLRLAKETP